MGFKDRLENTDYYKGLTAVQKNITSKRANWVELEHQFTVAKNIGFANWVERTKYNHITHNIVKELLEIK